MTEQLLKIAKDAETALADIFADIDAVSMKNTEKVRKEENIKRKNKIIENLKYLNVLF